MGAGWPVGINRFCFAADGISIKTVENILFFQFVVNDLLITDV
jgi:hypothetical protein